MQHFHAHGAPSLYSYDILGGGRNARSRAARAAEELAAEHEAQHKALAANDAARELAQAAAGVERERAGGRAGKRPMRRRPVGVRSLTRTQSAGINERRN